MISYRDELALTEYMLRNLEHRLAGRDAHEIVKIYPTDRCQLGVLAPRDVHIDTQDPPDGDEGSDAAGLERSRPLPANVRKISEGDVSESEVEEDSDNGTADFAPVVVSERAWRPASSLGTEFVLLGESSEPKISVDVTFSFYLPYHASFEVQRAEIGTEDDASERSGQVSLVQVFRRFSVTVKDLVFGLRGAQEIFERDLIQREINQRLDNHRADPMAWHDDLPRRTIPVQSLQSEDSYHAYLRSLPGSRELVPLQASLQVLCESATQGQRVAVYLRNDTEKSDEPRKNNCRNLVDAKIEVAVLSGRLLPIELVPVPEDYQYDREVYAIGRNTSVELSPERRRILTRSLARYPQKRRTTSSRVSAAYSELDAHPFETLESIRIAMIAYADDWNRRVLGENILRLDERAKAQCRKDLEMFRSEIGEFSSGIAALASDDNLLHAFRAMNRAFSSGKYKQWHLFQIVFIVIQLSALALREGISHGEWPRGEIREWASALKTADVLWFPTGGGKTEAYLGLFAVAALFDRLRGKQRGVTAWLRFPLRMLSVQQLQRAARIVIWTERERRHLATTLGRDLGEQFSLGYLVGKSNTPNRFIAEWSFDRLASHERQREKLLLVKDCPQCGGIDLVRVRLEPAVERAILSCEICGDLPIFVSDSEVYRFLPTLLVGTVDKLASLAYQPLLAQLWNGPEWKCSVPGHGYGSGGWCLNNCPTNGKKRGRPVRAEVKTKDAAPSLHVQDELHLLQEELGAFAGHYETTLLASEFFATNARAKIIAATATIQGYEHQLRDLYGARHVRRFPNRGYDLGDTFYSELDRDESGDGKVARIFTAFRPPYLNDDAAAAMVTETIHSVINHLRSDPIGAMNSVPLLDVTTGAEVEALLAFYSRTLTYVGNRDKGIRISKRLERTNATTDRSLRPNGARDLRVEYLSSHSTLREIAAAIGRLESVTDWDSPDFLDATVATDIISHGVDVETLNAMVMQRIPEDAAAYIQASSRCGRKHVGFVVGILPRHSLRASSIYDRFVEYHKHVERLVAPVPINRFARHAVKRTFPGIMMSIINGRFFKNTVALTKAQKLSLLRQAFGGSPDRWVNAPALRAALDESYVLLSDIYPYNLILSMRADIERSFALFQRSIRMPNHRELMDVFQPKPMSSLRDVDTAVRFFPDRDIVDDTRLSLFSDIDDR